MSSGLVGLGALLAVLASSSIARAESPVRLRIVSWNVWGVPAITTHLDERMAALPDAIAGLEPDVVCLQELWEARHAESVSKRLGERGFREFRHFEAPSGPTGLFVASKLPLGKGVFRRFSSARTPHSFWHLDWMVEKGVADVSVLTALGELHIALAWASLADSSSDCPSLRLCARPSISRYIGRPLRGAPP